jgi:alkanesulfonate monooxygenase SsuD/methylene tetrahydromethanopterin reductase-like flavin-dependent oxidoreductase (luciferase family)
MTTPKGLQFGIFPTPKAASFDEDLRLIRLADDIGLDLVGIQDHPYQRRFLDVFMLMSWALASTQNIRVFPDVANLAMRAPAMIAKASASLDVMSRGRSSWVWGQGASTTPLPPWAVRGARRASPLRPSRRLSI